MASCATFARMTPLDHLLYGLAWLSFGLLHSLLAREGAKQRLGGLLGGGYRLAYNGFALLHILAVAGFGDWLARGGAGGNFTARPDWLSWLQSALALAGFAVMLLALRSYDLGRFGGLTQFRQKIPPHTQAAEEPLVISGLHRYVRHPIYFGLLLFVWGLARDQLSLATAFWASLYLVIGSRFEERDLLRRFGESYADYRRRVPALIPWRGRRES
ncbi:MAG: isoprenylcysteine carboxylmethyltransferase family protein [Limibacillus sp.]